MKKLTPILLLLLISASPAFAEMDSNLDIFSKSAASVDDITAGFVNPAGLGMGWVMSLRYIHAFPDSSFKGDNALLLASRGNMISVQWLRHTNNLYRIKYLLAAGKQLFPSFYWGLSFSYFRGSQVYKNEKVWALGFMYHPTTDFSLGLVVDDLNEPVFDGFQLARKYTFGASHELKSISSAVSVDAWVGENQHFRDTEAKFRFEIKPIREITLMAHYTTEGMFQAGLVYNFNYISVGGAGDYDHDNYTGGTLFYNQRPVENTGY
jgi:hypothetical protein